MEDVVEEMEEFREELNKILTTEDDPVLEWHGKGPNKSKHLTKRATFSNTVDIGGMKSGYRVRFMGQIIQAIKDKHDELKKTHKDLKVTIVMVTYNDQGLMHDCEHIIWDKGQPGNVVYRDLGSWCDVYHKINNLKNEVKMDQYKIAEILLSSSATGEPITISSIVDKGGDKVMHEHAGSNKILFLGNFLFY